MSECKYCHGDPAVAGIAQRMGFRPDVAFARIQQLEAELKSASQWISVNDMRPEVGQMVLTYTPCLDSGRNATELRLLSWFKQCDATHWQPVEPPK